MRKSLRALFAAASSVLVIGWVSPQYEAEAATRKKPSATSQHKNVKKIHRTKAASKSRKMYKKRRASEAMRRAAENRKQAKQYFEQYGLPGAQNARALQRMLHMAGYDIGMVDGKVQNLTLHQGIKRMLTLYPDKFKGLFEGVPEDLTAEKLAVLVPAIYERVAAVGILRLQAEPERWTMMVRATGTETVYDDRTMVRGEFIIRAPDGREVYVVEKGGGYALEVLSRKQMEARSAGGETIYRPMFNSGGLNFGKVKKANQKASLPWNPYPGSALPGFSGGTVYRLEIKDELLNIKSGVLPRSFGDKNGYRSWIAFRVVDPGVVKGRDGFGAHVDGRTASPHPNDGTAGCLGVHEQYARLFFDFIKNMPEAQKPSHFIMLPPADPQLAATKDVENFFEALFGIPRDAAKALEKLLKSGL